MFSGPAMLSSALCTRPWWMAMRMGGGAKGLRRAASSSSSSSAHSDSPLSADAILDPYTELGLTPDATPTEIREAFYRRAKLHHPDVNPGQRDRFLKLQEAYRLLKNPERRQQYDSKYAVEKTLEKKAEDLEVYFSTRKELSQSAQLPWRERLTFDMMRSNALRNIRRGGATGPISVKSVAKKLDEPRQELLLELPQSKEEVAKKFLPMFAVTLAILLAFYWSEQERITGGKSASEGG